MGRTPYCSMYTRADSMLCPGCRIGNPERVKDGAFGANMKVDILNDGPVTLVIDSEQKGG